VGDADLMPPELQDSGEAPRRILAVVHDEDAQERGRREWYEAYRVRIATVEREYGAG